MISKVQRNSIRQRVHTRIRRKVQGSGERPRLNVYRSLNHIYAQIIDDMSGTTLASASTSEGNSDGKKSPAKSADKGGEKRAARRTGGNVASAREIGKLIAERAQKKGVKKVVFDRGGYLYHGRIKALAEAAREAGLEF